MPLRRTVPAVQVRTTPLVDTDADVLALAVSPGDAGPQLGVVALEALTGLDTDSDVALSRSGASGTAAQTVSLPVLRADGPVERIVFVGTGNGSPLALRRAGAAVARAAAKGRRVATDLGSGNPEQVRAFVEGFLLAAYHFSRASRPKLPTLARLDLHGGEPASVEGGSPSVNRAVTTARAVHLARDLANTPPAEKSPAWLARQAVTMAGAVGLEASVRDEKALREEGFGGLVAVGAGSSRPPRLVEVGYRPAGGRARSLPHVVLVGKGITFDSGGLSLKPHEAMLMMKTDMAAGAAVLAVLSALPALGVRARVTGLVAAAENLPGASAYRPGDVIRHYGGRTVEVLNTDAEGRLVLADALAYADRHLHADVVIDLATLTGAASRGLGRGHAALFTADEDLAGELTAAGTASGDLVWRMPLVEDYREALDSDVADLANIARDRSISGGSIVAALFLREFAGTTRWAHLDIAGPARSERDQHELCRGATGFGVRLLLRWLERWVSA